MKIDPRTERQTEGPQTVPNEQQSACIAPHDGRTVKTSFGASLDPQRNEGESFMYRVSLSADPTPHYGKGSVVVEVTTSDPKRCAISVSEWKDRLSAPFSSSSSSLPARRDSTIGASFARSSRPTCRPDHRSNQQSLPNSASATRLRAESRVLFQTYRLKW